MLLLLLLFGGPRRKWCSLLFSWEDERWCSLLFVKFGRVCWPIAETKRTDGGLELIDTGGSEFTIGLDIFGGGGGAVNVAGGSDVWYSEGARQIKPIISFSRNFEFNLLAVGGGGIPSVSAFAISWLNGKGVGGGGKLKLSGRFGKRFAIEFGGGTKRNN